MTTIKDPLLEPFYIGKDAHCYTAYEEITPDNSIKEYITEWNSIQKEIKNLTEFNQL